MFAGTWSYYRHHSIVSSQSHVQPMTLLTFIAHHNVHGQEKVVCARKRTLLVSHYPSGCMPPPSAAMMHTAHVS
jgi:hypothetical protein